MRGRGCHPKPRGAKGKPVHMGSGHGLKAIIPPAIFWLCCSQMECPGSDLSPQMKLRGMSIKVKSPEMRQPEREQSALRTQQEGMKAHTELASILMTTVVECQNSF